MDSWCVSMKSSTQFCKVTSGFVSNGDEGFWGERIKGGVNSSDLNNFVKSSKIARRVRMIKPGAAFSVLTSGNGKETLVSKFFTSELNVWNRKHKMLGIRIFKFMWVFSLTERITFYFSLEENNLKVFDLNIR